MSGVRILASAPTAGDWTGRLEGTWYHWRRLESVLRGSWEGSQLESLAAESLRVLGRIGDPHTDEGFLCRGLVVGYVQSGKTANYTAVAARAVDAGYRMVIVLSGIHDSLRSQTQNRLERELTGHQASPGTAPAERGREWICLTTPTDDFKEQDVRILQSPAPFLAVVKKNVAILQKLDTWLADAQRYLDDMAVLVIDDEADQASINTRGNRPQDPAVVDDEATEDPNAPSRTNALIRSILTRARKATYVAYTATPFANILISPESIDRIVGGDLFPRDFVLQLPRPRGYTGTEELFGVSAQGRTVLQPVADDDVRQLRSPRGRSKGELVIGLEAQGLPPSLSDALICFCLAAAVRALRGQTARPNTMLVHVSQRVADQERIASLIRDQLELWREARRQGQQLTSILAAVWERMGEGVQLDVPQDALMAAAVEALEQIIVLELNSATGEDLEYGSKPARHIVAVGGNRLSRGLTLEGLTISYFLRTATMCDTLLQMARWYGFRQGYEDLIRIYTTDGIARWFAELALVEQSLRDSIIALNRAGRRPDQMAIRLRAHSELLLTARNKSGTAQTMQDSWSGEHPQTVLLPMQEPAKLQKNLQLVGGLLAQADFRPVSAGLLARDVSATVVTSFLQDYRTHDDSIALRSDELADWITARTASDELTDWSVLIASPKSGTQIMLGGQPVRLVRRKRISSQSIGILTDPAHEGVDLPGGPGAFLRDSGNYDAEAMRAARPASQGLLIVYPLDPQYMSVSGAEAVVAIALSLPQTSDGASTWVVNSQVADD